MSYWIIAELQNWFGHPELRLRTNVEEYSRDSYENVLFRYHLLDSWVDYYLTLI
jgi:hypothetical protein